jgi:hypothetical protein
MICRKLKRRLDRVCNLIFEVGMDRPSLAPALKLLFSGQKFVILSLNKKNNGRKESDGKTG